MSSDVIALSRITYKKMMQNLVWATAYNVIAIPACGWSIRVISDVNVSTKKPGHVSSFPRAHSA